MSRDLPFSLRYLAVKSGVLPVLSSGAALTAIAIERLVAGIVADKATSQWVLLLAVGLAASELRGPLDQLVTGRMERSAERWTCMRMLDASMRAQKLDRVLDPAYHTQAYMARMGAQQGALLLSEIVSRLVGSLLTVGVLATALARLNGLLLVLMVMVAVLAVTLEGRFGRDRVEVEQRTSPQIRLHDYLQQLPYNPSTATEVRLFSLVDWLKDRAGKLLEERHLTVDRLSLRVLGGRSVVSALSVGVSVLAVLLTSRGLDPGEATQLILILPAVQAAQALGATLADSWGSGRAAMEWLRAYSEFAALPPDTLPVDDPPQCAAGSSAIASAPPLLSINNVSYGWECQPGLAPPCSLDLAPPEVARSGWF